MDDYWFTKKAFISQCLSLVATKIKKIEKYWGKRSRRWHFLSINYCLGTQLIHDGGPYHIETNPLICGVSIWHKEFKSGLCKFCGRQLLKNLKGWSA